MTMANIEFVTQALFMNSALVNSHDLGFVSAQKIRANETLKVTIFLSKGVIVKLNQ